MCRYSVCNTRWVQQLLVVLLACIESNRALIIPQKEFLHRSYVSGRTRVSRPQHHTFQSPPSLGVSELFLFGRSGKKEKYTIYGKVKHKNKPGQKKQTEPKIVEKFNIYGKRPPPPPDGKVRPLLDAGKKQKIRTNADNLFDKLDTDHDGLLSRSDLAASTTFERLDVNHDGFIDKEEFERASQSERDRTPINNMASIGQEIEVIEDAIGELAPLERQSFRLQGFDPYILVSVLTAGESFDVVSSYKPSWDRMAGETSLLNLTNEDLFMQLLLVIGAASTLLGAYAAVTFSLTVLYGKTAIGLDKDEAYYEFLDNTGLQRFRAFKAFTASLGLFCIIVFLELFQKTPSVLRIPVTVMTALFLYFGRSEYKFIIDAAGPIFAPKATAEVSEEEDDETDE